MNATDIIDIKDSPTYSRCGKARYLSLVTIPYSTDERAGRLLMYCGACRRDMGHLVDVSIPKEMLTHSLFLELYRLGRTSSDPQTAVEIAFGGVDQSLQEQAERILQGDWPL